MYHQVYRHYLPLPMYDMYKHTVPGMLMIPGTSLYLVCTYIRYMRVYDMYLVCFSFRGKKERFLQQYIFLFILPSFGQGLPTRTASELAPHVACIHLPTASAQRRLVLSYCPGTSGYIRLFCISAPHGAHIAPPALGSK